MNNTVLFGTLVACFIMASWFFPPPAMAIAVIFPGPAYTLAMPGLKSVAACEKAEVAMAAKAAAARRGLDRLVIGIPLGGYGRPLIRRCTIQGSVPPTSECRYPIGLISARRRQ